MREGVRTRKQQRLALIAANVGSHGIYKQKKGLVISPSPNGVNARNWWGTQKAGQCRQQRAQPASSTLAARRIRVGEEGLEYLSDGNDYL